MIQKIFDLFERHAFGVCEWWGRKLGIKAHRVRVTFIYVSFITLGSPLIIYLAMAFILDNKAYFKPRRKRSTIWEL